jgi:N-acetylneuraminate lyase
MRIEHLTGLIAAPPTPMRRNGSVDLDTVERLHAALCGNGVRGAFVCGTTGEGVSLSLEERRAVAERWQQLAEGEFVVIVHVGHNSLPESRALAEHARSIGAHAVALMAPSFFKPAGIEELVAFSAAVAEAAPELPFYYYHIPALTGVAIPVADFLEAASGRIPALAGAKFTYEDLLDYGRCLSLEGGRFDMLFGRDEILLSALALGARGAVGTTYNFAAPIYREVVDAWFAGDVARARARQARAAEMVNVMNRCGGLAAVKPIMRMIGLDCGPPRPPLRRLNDMECAELRRRLEGLGFLDFCCKV